MLTELSATSIIDVRLVLAGVVYSAVPIESGVSPAPKSITRQLATVVVGLVALPLVSLVASVLVAVACTSGVPLA